LRPRGGRGIRDCCRAPASPAAGGWGSKCLSRCASGGFGREIGQRGCLKPVGKQFSGHGRPVSARSPDPAKSEGTTPFLSRARSRRSVSDSEPLGRRGSSAWQKDCAYAGLTPTPDRRCAVTSTNPSSAMRGARHSPMVIQTDTICHGRRTLPDRQRWYPTRRRQCPGPDLGCAANLTTCTSTRQRAARPRRHVRVLRHPPDDRGASLAQSFHNAGYSTACVHKSGP